MAGYLAALTIGGGVPLFNRKYGDLKQLPFPLLASLNGVALFSKNYGVHLISAVTKDCKLIWRDYHNSIRLVVVVPNDAISDVHLHRLLDNVFQSMVLLLGLDDLVALRNVDRTKRDLRAAFPVIDFLMEAAVQPQENHKNFGDLAGCVDCVAFPEANLVQNYLDTFVECVDSTYGCVMSENSIVAATKNWFSLHPDELVLLSLLLQSDTWAVLRDTPVFLPVKSPTVPFRLVTCELIRGVSVCALCGPSPSLNDIRDILNNAWKPSHPLLASLQSIQPRRFPPLPIDQNIAGFVMLNLERRKLLSSMSPHAGNPAVKDPLVQMGVGQKYEALRAFYRSVVGPIFPDIFVANPYSVDQSCAETIAFRVPHAQLHHQVSETCITADQFKCYALQHLQFQLFLLFSPLTPNHFMRNISHRTMSQLTKDKHFAVIK